jgi:hypothetical protein
LKISRSEGKGHLRLKIKFSEVRRACALAQAMVDTVREPLIVLDKDL